MTSPAEKITIDCPNCGHRYEDWHRASINADVDPAMAADAEYVRQASTATCPECSHVVDIGTVLVGATYRLNHDDMTLNEGARVVSPQDEDYIEALQRAIASGELDEADTAHAYQWIRFCGRPEDITVRDATPDELRQVFGDEGGDR